MRGVTTLRGGWGLGALLMMAILTAGMLGCRSAGKDTDTVVMAIENSPTNLDLRMGTDAMSERIGGLIFDALLRKDEHYTMQPWLALSWEAPDRAAGHDFWVFHLRDGVHFHDGRPLRAQDVAWTINSLIDGSLVTSKAGAFASVARAEARDRLTVVVRMKRADASLLFNLSDGLFGVVPEGSGKDFGRAPVGSGAFRFVSQRQDSDVVLERNQDYWGGADQIGTPSLRRVRFAVVPDAVTVALELEKGSIDLASNQLTLDMVHSLAGRPELEIVSAPGSPVMYLNFNCAAGSSHAPLSDVRVRRAIAFAIDRQAIIDAAWRGQARLASTLLPEGHWASPPEGVLAAYGHDPGRAAEVLETAGYRADRNGVRLRLEMKISTDDTTRLLAEILQQQMAAAGIALTLRSSEFGTFYSDVTGGRFQMYALRWIGSNEDPDIFRYAFGSDRFPPKGGNRGRFINARVDELLAQASATTNQQAQRQLLIEVQQVLAAEVPAIPLWYPNNELVHTRRVTNVTPRSDGSFGFLREARLR